MSSFAYQTDGTCSSKIELDIEGDVVRRVKFVSGCPGNTAGVARLAEGRSAREVIALLRGIPCGDSLTSCPDQLARALEAYLGQASTGP